MHTSPKIRYNARPKYSVLRRHERGLDGKSRRVPGQWTVMENGRFCFYTFTSDGVSGLLKRGIPAGDAAELAKQMHH